MSAGDLADALDGIIGRAGLDRALGPEPLDAVELMTVGDDGWPHCALLSAGEVVGAGDGRLGLLLWKESRTAANLRRDGRGLLQAVRRGSVVKARIEVEALGDVMIERQSLAAFLATGVEVAEDRVPYAQVTSGVTFRLVDAAPTVARWREQLDAFAHAQSRQADGPR